MANSYTQLYVQIIFAVKGRENLIAERYRDELEKYICGIISKGKSKALAIYCNPDHVHILIGLNPMLSVSDLVRDIKSNSSKFINKKGWFAGEFSWQEGYGAFTHSKSQLDVVYKYILGQAEHHKRRSFKEEYLGLLQKWEVEYNEMYLFEWDN